MLPLKAHFEEMCRRIKPPQERRDLAKTLPTTVRDHLVQSGRLETMETGTTTRLAGSYGRKTGVDDIKDVDIVVFVARRYEHEDPEVVLDDLAAALKDLEVDGYGKGEVRTRRKNRRSHHVEFRKDGEESFHIDCVPVIRHGDDPTTILRIPDREWKRWDDTQPIGYGDRLTDLNQANDERVLPTIRMLKRIRNQQLRKTLTRPKSFWLEAKVFDLWEDGRLSPGDSWSDLMYDLLRELRDDCRVWPDRLRIYDPCLGRDLTQSWQQGEYDDFVSMLDRVLGHLDPVADSSDEAASVEAWRRVFGAGVFALPDDSERTATAARAVASGATVTKAGAVVPTAAGIAGVVSPAHRFYGGRR